MNDERDDEVSMISLWRHDYDRIPEHAKQTITERAGRMDLGLELVDLWVRDRHADALWDAIRAADITPMAPTERLMFNDTIVGTSFPTERELREAVTELDPARFHAIMSTALDYGYAEVADMVEQAPVIRYPVDLGLDDPRVEYRGDIYRVDAYTAGDLREAFEKHDPQQFSDIMNRSIAMGIAEKSFRLEREELIRGPVAVPVEREQAERLSPSLRIKM